MQFSQKKMLAGDKEAAIEYLSNGIRTMPKNHELLFNYAVANQLI